MTEHPDDSTLQRMLEGQLSDDEVRALDEHIDACEPCRQLLAALVIARPASEAGAAAIDDAPPTIKSVARRPPGRRRRALEPGARVDNFVVQRLIGRGGMGEVYLARDSKLERSVALKLISAELLTTPEAYDRFMEEARTTARFSHPHIVAIHAVGEHEGQPYMALEYLHGETLAQLMSRRPPSVERTVQLGMPIAEALAEAHRRGVLHRDLKPSNVMIDAGGRLRVLDFGLSRAVTAAREPHAEGDAVEPGAGIDAADLEVAPSGCFGTPTYMAPEQWRATQVSPATDVWALGMILYQLACGYRPYDELPTVRSLMVEVMSPTRVPPIARVAPEPLPDALSALIDRCLHKDPDARPDAAEVADILRTLQAEPRPTAAEAQTEAQPAEAEAQPAEAEAQSAEASIPPRAASARRAWLARVGAVAGIAALAVAAFFVAATSRRQPRGAALPPVSGPPLRYGLFPAVQAEVVRRELAPLLLQLRRVLRRRIIVVTPKSYGALRRALLRGELDFATLPPLQFALARARVRALAAHRYEGASQGYLVARASSAVRDLASARGKRVCYVEKGSTSGYLLPRRFLRARGIDPDKSFSAVRYSGTHPQVLRDLVAGRCDLGAVFSEAYLRADRLGISRATLQVLAITGAVPSDVVAASPKLSASLTSRLRRALLGFTVKRGRTVSEVYPFTITGFSAVKTSAYNDLVD
ncbi:MAG: PhnD/SsuA/transferrin family substrate-binding protein [Myxococcales bacterium]|nr:PhnD/SsuA/transferrin family substrate-binding protein [Myxococcales bacterium]